MKIGKKEWLRLESRRFTSLAAFVREVSVLLTETDYRLSLVILEADRERLDAELSGLRTLGRLKVTVL